LTRADGAYEEEHCLAPDLQVYWILVDGSKAGGTAFYPHVDIQDDLREDGENVPQQGTLYIETTGLLAQHRGCGLGTKIKAWQIDYPKSDGFQAHCYQLSSEQFDNDFYKREAWLQKDTNNVKLLRGRRGDYCFGAASVASTCFSCR